MDAAALSARTILEALLEAVETAGDLADEERQGPRLSATGHCLRQQYYHVTGAEKAPIGADARLEMNDGNVHEADVKHWLRAAGYEVSAETEVGGRNEGDEVRLELSDDWVVLGHIDGDLAGAGLDGLVILEVKSMGDLRFIDFIENGLRASAPDYWDQVQGYMMAREREQAAVVVKAKDSGAVRGAIARRGWKNSNKPWYGPHDRVAVSPAYKLAVEVIDRDDLSGARVIERHMRLMEAVQTGVPPDREYARSNWHCRYCPFQQTCWGE